MKKEPGWMRNEMPSVTQFIDNLREVFGKEEVDKMIRDGLRNGTFYAEENGHVIGNKPEKGKP